MCSAVIIYIIGMVLSAGLVAGPVRVPSWTSRLLEVLPDQLHG